MTLRRSRLTSSVLCTAICFSTSIAHADTPPETTAPAQPAEPPKPGTDTTAPAETTEPPKPGTAAQATAPTKPSEPTETSAPAKPNQLIATSAKRAMPDYDGRGNPDAEAGSWILWGPRILLSPLYVINEVIFRRGLGYIVTRAERGRWINDVASLFTFGPNGNNLLMPTALVDFGLLPSIGFYFSADGLFADKNNLRVSASTGGRNWLTATAVDRYSWNNGGTQVQGRFEFTRRPDYLFFGIGPDITSATRSRYGLQRLEGSASYRRRIVRESYFSLGAGFRGMAYRKGGAYGDPAIEDRIAVGELPAPPGLGLDYSVAFQRAEVVLDSRPPRPEPANGGYLKLRGETNLDITNDRKWINYGAVVGGAIDLNGLQRQLRAQVAVNFSDPIKGEVPFNELASLGSDLMPGFINGWMVGRSTAAAQIGYTWPVWVFLDGQARLSVGNAFNEHLSGLSFQKLRLSADIGVTSIGARDAGFEILFGVGTETFEQGGGITSVRLTFGTRHGF